MESKAYLGDGVYVRFDGDGVWLEANMPTTDRVYLEPSVFNSLVEFWKRCHNPPEPNGFFLDDTYEK